MSDSDGDSDEEFLRELNAVGPGRKSGTKAVTPQRSIGVEFEEKAIGVEFVKAIGVEVVMSNSVEKFQRKLDAVGPGCKSGTKAVAPQSEGFVKKAAIKQARKTRISMGIERLRDSASTSELFWISGYRGETNIFIPGRLLSRGATTYLNLSTKDMLVEQGFDLQDGEIAGIFFMKDSGESDVHWLQVDGKEVRKRPFIPGDALFEELSNQPKLWSSKKRRLSKNQTALFKQFDGVVELIRKVYVASRQREEDKAKADQEEELREQDAILQEQNTTRSEKSIGQIPTNKRKRIREDWDGLSQEEKTIRPGTWLYVQTKDGLVKCRAAIVRVDACDFPIELDTLVEFKSHVEKTAYVQKIICVDSETERVTESRPVSDFGLSSESTSRVQSHSQFLQSEILRNAKRLKEENPQFAHLFLKK